jgi:hypothetical protein
LWGRVPGAMQRSSRCFAEPGHTKHRRLVRPRLSSAPLRKGYALRCVRGTVKLYRALACGTVSISFPANTGGKVGLPFGEPPDGSTVTA